MFPNWQEVQLGKIADFRNGINYTKDSFGFGVRVIGVKDFQDRVVPIYDDLEEINPEGVVREIDLLKEDDVLFVRSNGNRQLIGRSLFMKGIPSNITHSAFTIRARFFSPQVEPRFYAYLFRSDFIRSILSSYGSGTNISNLNQQILGDLKVPNPPLPTQRKIAAILSAYDDLIENNRRRIQILEEMAQAIYREWFVHLRFPGHEQVKLVDSGTELGMVPEGWEIGTIADLCDFIERGVTPKYTSGSERFIINQKSNRGTFIDFAQLKELDPELYVPKEKFARIEDVLINSLGEGTLGRIHYFLGPDNEWAVDQHMTICRSSISGSTVYIYYYLSSKEGQARIEGLKTGGTNMTMLNISEVRQFKLLVPPEKYLEKFYHSINSFWHLMRILELKNTNLKRTRDMILPRLISGELEVSELEIQGV